MKILFAINEDVTNSDNSLETRILNRYRELNGYGFEFDKAANLGEIMETLKSNISYDLLILNEELEISNPITPKELRQIKNISEETRIILIFNNESKDDNFINTLHNLGIHDFISSEEITMDKIIDLIMGRDISKTEKKEIRSNRLKLFNSDSERIITKTIVQDRIIGTVTIGVGGAMYNSGTTHTTLGIASYLNGLDQKVAVLEFNDKPCMKNLLSVASFNNVDYLTVNDIDIYFQKSNKADLGEFNQQLSEIKSKDYKYIIMDLGALKKFNAQGIIELTSSYHEIWRTDYQVLCLNGSIWKWSDVYYYRYDDYAELEGNIGLWKLLINLSTYQNFKYIKKEARGTTVINDIVLSPVYIDPFIIDENTGMVFYELLKEVLPVNLIGREKTK